MGAAELFVITEFDYIIELITKVLFCKPEISWSSIVFVTYLSSTMTSSFQWPFRAKIKLDICFQYFNKCYESWSELQKNSSFKHVFYFFFVVVVVVDSLASMSFANWTHLWHLLQQILNRMVIYITLCCMPSSLLRLKT